MGMSGTITALYEAQEEVVRTLERSTRSSSIHEAKMRGPLVVDDTIARQWVELCYLYASDFRPHRLPASGEICGWLHQRDEAYLLVDGYSMIYFKGTIHGFRTMETEHKSYLDSMNRLFDALPGLNEKVAPLLHSPDQQKEISDRLTDSRNAKEFFNDECVVLPTPYLALQSLLSLGTLPELTKLRPEIDDLAMLLTKAAHEYDNIRAKLKIMTEGGFKIPMVRDELIWCWSTTHKFGGSSMWHNHPAANDLRQALPSEEDIKGHFATYLFHQRKEEEYVLYLPKKDFFGKVQEEVDAAQNPSERDIEQIIQKVLDRDLPKLMEDEILGFKVALDFQGKKVDLFPLISAQEYKKHQPALEKWGKKAEPLHIAGIELVVPTAYPYQPSWWEQLRGRLGLAGRRIGK